MGFFDQVTSAAKEIASAIPGLNDLIGNDRAPEIEWQIDGTDWYKIYPFQFVIINTDGSKGDTDFIYYTLPIPPQTINIQAIPAAQATPTFGGVVEEVNKNVFYNISLIGTTGVAVSRDPENTINVNGSKIPSFPEPASNFRDKISTSGLLSGIATQLNQGVNQIGGAIDGTIAAAQAAASGDVVSAIGAATNVFTNAALPPLPYSNSSVSKKNNGFTEMHWMQYFFYTYSKIKGENPNNYRLEFRHLKMQKRWRITTPLLSITQSSQNPMSYRYQMNIKAWDISQDTTKQRNETVVDRFGANGDLKSVNAVDVRTTHNIIKNLF